MSQEKGLVTMEPKKSNRLRGLMLLCACLALPSCTTMQAYPGPKLPREQIAVIERRAQHFALIYGLTIYIGTIDGQADDATASEIEILPGLHELTLVGQTSYPLWATPLVLLINPKFGPNKLSVRAEAGRSYRLASVEFDTKAYWVWVEDDQGEVAGGERREAMPRPKRQERDEDNEIRPSE